MASDDPPAERVRVLYIHNSGDLYGASRSLARLVSRVDRTRFEPVVLLPEHGPLEEKLTPLGVTVLVDPWLSIITRTVFRSWKLVTWALSFPISVLRLVLLLRRHRIDIVHTNSGVILSPGLACRLARVPLVWHIREWFGDFDRLWAPYSAYLKWAADRIVAVSTSVAEQFGNSRKVLVINNGLEEGEFTLDRPAAREEFRRQHRLDDAVVLGVVGRIKFGRKGQEVLVQAAALLRDKVGPFRVLIVGSAHPGNADHLDRLRELIDRLGMKDLVHMAGELADPRPAYAAMDCFVLPSGAPEPFGGVVLEAMAMSLPVVATAIGGSVDQVEDGVTGYLVPPGDPRVLADRLATLIRDEEARRRMGEAGRRRLDERFTLAKTVAAIQNCYASVLPAREERR